MNQLEQLKLHVGALAAAVEADPKFFAAVVHYVARFRQLLRGQSGSVTQDELGILAAKLEEFWGKWRPSGEGLYVPPRQTADTDDTVRQIGVLVRNIRSLDEQSFNRLAGAVTVEDSASMAPVTPAGQRCVFLGHGRSRLWARVKMFLEDDLGLATVTYESESRTGESMVPVLEQMLGQATFAVLVLTGEHDTTEGTRRARQNVIHEAGLFQGRLGFKRAVLLIQEGVEPFSNVAGLQHIRFSAENIEQTFYELQRVLEREGQLPGPGRPAKAGP